MRQVDPLDILETIRESLLVLEPDSRSVCEPSLQHIRIARIRLARSSMGSAADRGIFPSFAAHSK